jgi:glycosyltransferase involved in cell wall biosynthesis
VVEVVVPLRGDDPLVDLLVASLARQTFDGPWVLVLADNGSSDGLASLVSRLRGQVPSLRVVDARDRPGPSHARNVAAATCTAEHLVFLDADDEVAPGYLGAMVEALRTSEFVGARVDHDTLNPHPGEPFYPRWQAKGLGSLRGLPLAGAGTMGIRRRTFERLGGFDEELVGAEDDDLCVRAGLAGVTLRFAPDAVLHYRPRTGLRAIFRQQRSAGYHDMRCIARYADVLPPPRPSPDGSAPAPAVPLAQLWRNRLVRLPSLFRAGGRAWAAGALGRRLGMIEGRRAVRAEVPDPSVLRWG